LWSLIVYCHVYKSLPLEPIQSKFSLIHSNTHPVSLKIYLILFSQLHVPLSCCIFPWDLPIKFLCMFFIYMSHPCLTEFLHILKFLTKCLNGIVLNVFELPWLYRYISVSQIFLLQGFPFLFQQIKDCINLHQTRNLIYALCRWNERLAIHVVSMIFQAITKHTEVSRFKGLVLLIWITFCFCNYVSHNLMQGKIYGNRIMIDVSML
jgi:hypothetical protein